LRDLVAWTRVSVGLARAPSRLALLPFTAILAFPKNVAAPFSPGAAGFDRAILKTEASDLKALREIA
jgi:hypothetical protein